MEQNLLRFLGGRLGYPAGAEGLLTSGGSVGNLTAILAARAASKGGDALLVADTAHYSLARSARIAGFGADGLIAVPTDARFRLRPDALPAALAEARARGRKVAAVCASAGSTATGAFDPLEAVADFCAAEGLWLHVDGAHGASVALSDDPAHRRLLAGIERADSVVWDAHKMMLMPALVTAVLFRQGTHAYAAFEQEASYLFHAKDPRAEWFNVGSRTVECTKRMLGLKVYLALELLGTKLFGDYVDACLGRARRFAARLQEAPDFELPVEPECNIVCFRYLPPVAAGWPRERLDALQVQIRRALLGRGDFYLVQTGLPSGTHLRVTIINPLTTDEDLAALLESVRDVARALL